MLANVQIFYPSVKAVNWVHSGRGEEDVVTIKV